MNWSIKDIELRPLVAEPPWFLLLDADPDQEGVRQYLERGVCTCAWLGSCVVGVVVVVATRPHTMELVNVAVAPEYRGCGLGRMLIANAVEQAQRAGAKTLEVGTGNSSLQQLALYQKMGFRIISVDLDFFTRHYSEPIHENGLLCRDMIRLRLELTV